MADFVAVLKKTLDGLGETTPEIRLRVYDKARSTIAAKLAAIEPPPPAAVAERQRKALEDAIEQVEAGYAKPAAPASDPLAELENIFSSIDRNRNQPTHVRPGTTAASASAKADIAVSRTEPVEPPSPLDAKPEPAAPALEQPAPAPANRADSYPVDEPREAAVFDDALPDEGDGPVLSSDGVGKERRRGLGGPIAALVALAVIAGAGYGVWLNKDAFMDMFGFGEAETVTVETAPAEQAEPAATADAEAETPAAREEPVEATPPAQAESQKFTQRLLPDGQEVDPGPAGGGSQIGEGTSVMALTTPPSDAAAPAAPAESAPPAAVAGEAVGEPSPAPASSDEPSAVAVGQKAIFYEERTNTAQGSAEPGSIVWSLVQESPGGEAPPEPAIRAEASIPGKDVQLRMTIRRNADETLPASHIIEMIFLTPDGFEGGTIDNVLRIAMKRTEQEAGSPLIGIPAKIADGFFLVALNDTKADEAANLTLLRNQGWIDIPVVYKTGRRALLTMEKGIPGDQVFDEALKAWQENSPE